MGGEQVPGGPGRWRLARPLLAALVDDTGASGHLGVLDGWPPTPES